MIEVPFDEVRVGKNYFLQFYGHSLEYLKAINPQISHKFYGKCIEKFDLSKDYPNIYPPNTMALKWELNDDEAEAGIPTIYSRDFDFYQNNRCSGGFTSSETIKYFQRASTPKFTRKNKLIEQIFHGIQGISDIKPSVLLGPETVDYAERNVHIHHIPLDKLVKGTEYLIHVLRGNKEFNEKRKKEEISGSFIGTYFGNKLNLNGRGSKYIFCKIKFIDEIYKNHHITGEAVGIFFTEVQYKKPSGLDGKIKEGCIALDFFNFTVDPNPFAYIVEEMERQLVEQHSISSHQHKTPIDGPVRRLFPLLPFWGGSKISRKRKRRKTKSKTTR
jgi:hypothetical protein